RPARGPRLPAAPLHPHARSVRGLRARALERRPVAAHGGVSGRRGADRGRGRPRARPRAARTGQGRADLRRAGERSARSDTGGCACRRRDRHHGSRIDRQRAGMAARPARRGESAMNMAEDALATLRGRWLADEPMSRHVSWRAGGAARRAYVPADVDDLAAMLRALPRTEPVLFVGLGSNLLVRDGGYRGTVVLTHPVLGGMRAEGNVVHAGAGVASPKVARFAALNRLGGAEFLAGIPGTVGGALAMNAGCYGGETWQFVHEVVVLDRDGVLRRRARADYEVGYRHVALRRAPQ